MPSLTLIQIKRSIGAGATDIPASLANGEPAYTTNGEILYIGGESAVVPIGGRRFPGVLTANHALVANSTSQLDEIRVATMEIGAGATDTTLGRSGAGILTVEGIDVPTISSTSTLTAKTIDAGIFTGITDVQQSFELSGDISPTTLSAQTDDWAPTGLSTASTIRVILTGAQSLTGLTGGADGRLMMIHNIDSADILTIAHQSGASTAANRFAIGTNIALNPDESVLFQYDSTSSRWRALAGPSAVASLGDHLTDLDALSAVGAGDNIMVSTGAGTWAFETGDTARISLGVGSTSAPQIDTIELGAAADTTLSRSGAGVLAVEGIDVVSNTSGIQDLVTVGAVGGDSEFLVGTGAGTLAWENAATALTSMGAQAQGDVLDDLNTTGVVGGDSEFLVGTAAGAMSWEDAATARASMGAGVGTVTASGSPLDGEIAVWTSGIDIEGDALLTFVASDLTCFGPAGTGAASAGVLSLSTNETSVAVGTNDQLGRIDFQAPLETGADAIVVAASIWAEAAIDFDATNNATDLVFALGVSEVAAEKARLSSIGDWTIAGAFAAGTSDLAVINLTGSISEFDAALQSDTFLFTSELGSIAQAHGDVLDDFNTLTAVSSDGEFIVGTGSGAFAYESGTTVRDSLGLGTGDNVQFTNITATGDLTVSGTLTTIDTTNLVVQDPMIKLAKDNNAADALDIGFYGLYDDTGSQDVYTGLFRDASDGDKWKLFKLLQVEPTTTVDTGGTGYAQDTLVCALESDNVTITGGSIDAGTF